MSDKYEQAMTNAQRRIEDEVGPLSEREICICRTACIIGISAVLDKQIEEMCHALTAQRQ